MYSASFSAVKATSIATGETIMLGLNCGTVSSLAWPDLLAGIDAAIAIQDREADKAVHDLAQLGVSSGPCGAATLAALRGVLGGPHAAKRRATLQLGSDAVVVIVSTEGSHVYLDTAVEEAS